METTPLNVPGPAGTTTSAARILAGLGAVFGGFLLLLSLCGMLAYLVLPLTQRKNALENNILLASASTIGLLFGAIILVAAYSVIRGRPLPRFMLPSPLLFAGIFLVVIGIGQAVLFANVGTAYLFPPWHVLASLMLPLAALAYAARRLAPEPGQAVLAQFTWGGAGSVLLALVFELIVGGFLVLGVALVLALVLGPERLTQLARSLSNGTPNPERILALLSGEPVVLIIAAIAALAFFTVIGPLIEETLKGLGPGIWIARTRPTASRALLWGLASGAGFAFSENLLMGSNLVDVQSGAGALWAPLILARAGTSLVHVAATATVSLGWYSAFVQGKRANLLIFFFVGFAAHGSWNLLALVLTSAVSGAGLFGSPSGGLNAGSVLIGLVALAIFVSLVLAAILWIAWLIRWAKRRDQVQVTEPI